MQRTIVTLIITCCLGSATKAQPADSGAIYPKGTVVTANFTGTVWVRQLIARDSIFDLVAGSVTFSPDARSYWHTHNAGQILLITDGTGYTQEKGKPIRIIHKGDIVICPPNVEHWHGAAPGTAMTHISLNPNADKGVVTWLRPVTNEEYNKTETGTALLTNNKTQNKMELDSKQQSIVKISALTAIGDIEQLKAQFTKGLDDGLTINEIREILVQLYAYCGFPRSLNGINAFMVVLAERKAKGINDPEGKAASPVSDNSKYQTGKKNLQQLTGKEEKSLTGANAFAPAIDTFLKEHLFADIFSRDVLTFQQRELVTVSALAAMTGVASQLQAHIAMGINANLTPGQLLQTFGLIDKTVNQRQGDIARAALENVLLIHPD